MKSENFQIAVPHFYCLEYYEDDKKMIVNIDFREAKIFLNKRLIKQWEPPYDSLKVPEDKKVQILKNIRSYLLNESDTENIIMEEDEI